jgi:hypothetical protein
MTFDWQTEYARALELYGGDTPSPALEQELIEAFQQHPQAVTNAITKIGKAYAAGKIHSPWGALKAEIPKQISADIQVGDGHERNRAIRNAEQWMLNAGMHYPTWAETEDHLYGDQGNLRPWTADHALRETMHAKYTAARVVADLLDQQELERAQAWKEARAKPTPAVTDEERKCRECGYTTGHAPTCALLLKYLGATA